MASAMKSLRIPPELSRQAAARGDNLSDGIRECLDRYFHLLSCARDGLRSRFSATELSVLCRVAGAMVSEPHVLTLLPRLEDTEPVEAGCSVAEKSLLVEKLRELDPLEHTALVDAVERFWRACACGVPVDPARVLEA